MAPDTPTTGQNENVTPTPIRTIRIDDELWDQAQAKAKRRRETVAAVIRRALLEYIEEDA